MTEPQPSDESLPEGKEPVPRGTRIMAVLRWLILLAVLAVAVVSVADSAAPLLRGTGARASAAKFYCPMHPQITSETPGECPICHMSLEPIPEERKRTGSSPGSSAAPAPTTSATPAGAPAPPPGTTPIELTLDRVQAINLRTAPVEVSARSARLRVAAVVEAPEQSRAQVRVRAAGHVEGLRVRQTGVKVRAGELLASIYSPEIFQAQQELLAMNAWKSAATGAALPVAPDKRLELLGVSKQTVARILETKKPIRAIGLTAPVSGHVLAKNIELGAYVTPETVLFEIVDLSKVYVIASVFQHQLGLLKTGDSASFSTPSASGKIYEAKIDLIAPGVDLATRTGRVRFQLQNPDLALLPGQFGTAELGAAAGTQLTIPLDALIDTGTAEYVFVAAPRGRFVPRSVIVEGQLGDRWIVAGGLEPGERVVSSAAFMIDAESRLQASLAATAAEPAP
jgi:membrane fusion protein, copper/silver efflux system